ncbi:hypothetical protein [Nocardia sp. NPDC049149]|uniref:hypothetical protein n=1 Tax=Nocardia sp. NPDC049149 TaxID=3364315 RepID=UPI003722A040
MTYLMVDQRVRDVQQWAQAFGAGTERRRAAGGEVVLVLADPAEGDRVLVLVRFDSAAQALAWRNRPGVAQEIERGGVIADSVTVRVLDALPVA